ncbi:MAG: hypothetical protein AAF564_16710 [Bacteroidota bacterium]
MRSKMLLLVVCFLWCIPCFSQSTPEGELLEILLDGGLSSATKEARTEFYARVEKHEYALRALIISRILLPHSDSLLSYGQPLVSSPVRIAIGMINVVDSEETRVLLKNTYLTVAAHYDSLISLTKPAKAEGLSRNVRMEIIKARGGAAAIHNAAISALGRLGDNRVLFHAIRRKNKVGYAARHAIIEYQKAIGSN